MWAQKWAATWQFSERARFCKNRSEFITCTSSSPITGHYSTQQWIIYGTQSNHFWKIWASSHYIDETIHHRKFYINNNMVLFCQHSPNPTNKNIFCCNEDSLCETSMQGFEMANIVWLLLVSSLQLVEKGSSYYSADLFHKEVSMDGWILHQIVFMWKFILWKAST